ncbi:MAG TPA: hypothetical protein PLO89_10375 [Spirochaetota bacterium]|nr:hypothetical protein [Spirochaetota bacterium]
MKFVIFALSFFTAFNLFSFDIRNLNWGMTKAEVKKNEKEKLIGEDELTLRYFTIIKKIEFKLEYDFRKKILVGATYSTTKSYTPDLQLNVYYLLKNVIDDKYRVKSVKKHNIPKQYSKDILGGIKKGAVFLHEEWATPKTFIVLKLVSDKNGFINTSVKYFQKEYKEIVDNINKKDDKKDNKKKDIKKEKEDLKKYF